VPSGRTAFFLDKRGSSFNLHGPSAGPGDLIQKQVPPEAALKETRLSATAHR